MAGSRSWNLPDKELWGPKPFPVRYRGMGDLWLFPHHLLMYHASLEASVSILGISELWVHGPYRSGPDWDSPFIRQVYRELGDNHPDPFEDPHSWNHTSLELRVEFAEQATRHDCTAQLVYYAYHGRQERVYLFHVLSAACSPFKADPVEDRAPDEGKL